MEIMLKEGSMRALDVVQGTLAKLAGPILRPRRGRGFVCGECERWERCGLPPNDRCIVMIAQIARNGGRLAERPRLPQC
jgi:hypothetical protein